MEIIEKIRSFITTNFYTGDPASISDDTSLLEQGIVDSTGVLEVIAFLEMDLGVQVEDSEITPENLDSIGRIASFVQKKLAS